MIPNDVIEPSTETDLPPQPPADASPVHLARCQTCDHSVKFQPTPSGAAFHLIDSEGTYGLGEHGRPVCPNGHGEMEIADDQLPATDAITQVAGQLRGAEQQPLFEPPPFNSANALAEIFRKRHEIADLEREYDDAAKEAKKARDERDEARALLGKMIDRFEQESRQRDAEIERRRERRENPELAEVAIDDVVQTDEDAALIEQLAEAAGVVVTSTRLRGLSDELRHELEAWAGDAEHHPEERDRWMAARPRALAGMHIAAGSITSEAPPGDTYQCCVDCGARLGSVKTGDTEGLESYPAGTLVGEDCPGPEKPEPHRYPKKKKKKK